MAAGARGGRLVTAASVWWAGLLLIAAIILAAAFSAQVLRSRAMDTSQRDATTLSAVLAEQTTRYIQVIDHVLEELQSRSEVLGVATPEAFDAVFGTPDMHAFLRGRLQDLPEANAFVLVSAGGRMVNYSRADPPPAKDLSQVDYVTWFAAHDDTGLFVSAVRRSVVVGASTIYLARRINGPDHRFLGVAVGAIDVATLTSFYGAINTRPGQALTLLRRDGSMLIHVPQLLEEAGRVMPDNSPWFAVVAAGGGTYRSPGFLSGRPAMVCVHPLAHYPLVVDVSATEAVMLAAWRRQVGIITLATAVAVAGFGILFTVIALQVERQAVQTATLLRGATALRASQRALTQKSQLLETTLTHMQQGLAVIGADHRILVCNPRVVELLDLPPSLLAEGACYDDVIAWQWKHGELAEQGGNLQAFLHGDRLLGGLDVYTRRRPNGRAIEVRTAALPGGGAVRSFADVTDRQDALDLLTRAKEAAEATNRARSAFLANLSHELRTPLNAVIGFSELIRDQPFGPIAGPYVGYARDINASGKALLDLINALIDMAKIDAGRYVLAEEPVAVAALVRVCQSTLAGQAQEARVRLVTDPALTMVTVQADRKALKQVVQSLLSNAVRFTPSGGQVAVRAESLDDGGVALVVADTGVGIPPEVLCHLGEPFWQAEHAAARQQGGSGMGLALSRRLMLLHGGTLQLESRLGAGTTVRAVLPAARVRAAAARVAVSAPEAA